MTDFEGWMELCDLYLSQLDYSKACYCMEELIMSNPHNHLFYQKFAEVRNIMKKKYNTVSTDPNPIVAMI
jgi:hypothetical protein